MSSYLIWGKINIILIIASTLKFASIYSMTPASVGHETSLFHCGAVTFVSVSYSSHQIIYFCFQVTPHSCGPSK